MSAGTETVADRTMDRNAAAALTRHGVRRVETIDLLRGLVIALMVLDHVREYFSADALAFDPTDLQRTTPFLFATRWVTHLCAPTFVLLAGVAAFVQRAHAQSRSAVARFLLTRGLWLIALELTLISFAFNFAMPFLFLQVIWAIGIGMMLLAGLVWLPPVVVLTLGILISAAHDAFIGVQARDLGFAAPLWQLTMQPGLIERPHGLIAYPALPWFGVLCVGYGLGPVFMLPERARRRILAALGFGAICTFALLRALNAYGDPAHWASQSTPLFTALSFLRVSKYPPSLLYLLVTLGVSLLLGLGLEKLKGAMAAVLLAFGRTPLFTYLLHIFLVHGLALAVGVAMGFPASDFTHFLEDPSRLRAAGWGFGLPVVYGVWVLVLVILYPLARSYSDIKQRHRVWWMNYL